MTTFTSISNALVAVGAKPFATTVQALRDNPLAIAEGDPTAPKINQGALDRPTPGTQIRLRDDGVDQSSLDNSLVERKAFSFMQVGTIRLAYEHGATGANAGITEVRRVRAGASVTLSSISNVNAYVARTIDINILPGDRVSFWISGIAGGAPNRGLLRNVRIQTNGENIWVGGAESRVEGNTYA